MGNIDDVLEEMKKGNISKDAIIRHLYNVMLGYDLSARNTKLAVRIDALASVAEGHYKMGLETNEEMLAWSIYLDELIEIGAKKFIDNKTQIVNAVRKFAQKK